MKKRAQRTFLNTVLLYQCLCFDQTVVANFTGMRSQMWNQSNYLLPDHRDVSAILYHALISEAFIDGSEVGDHLMNTATDRGQFTPVFTDAEGVRAVVFRSSGSIATWPCFDKWNAFEYKKYFLNNISEPSWTRAWHFSTMADEVTINLTQVNWVSCWSKDSIHMQSFDGENDLIFWLFSCEFGCKIQTEKQ